jgi:2',3'-cyclic-nucleotide 2'-phosphodiesterase (5'-nucleotidase family)
VIRRGDAAGSPLGNLFAAALRDGVAGADIGVVNSATRGLWADLAAGPMTFGRLYDVFPFDNRIRRVTVTGAELRRWVANEIAQGRRSGLGLAGLTVTATCQRAALEIDLARDDGRAVRDDDRLLAVTIGAPTLSGGLASTDPLGAAEAGGNAAVVREVVEDWFTRLGRAPDNRIDELAHRTRTSVASEIGACGPSASLPPK